MATSEPQPNHRIRELRDERRLTQVEVAAAAGMQQNAYWRVETGKQELDIPTMRKIARALRVAPSQLLLDEDVELRAAGVTGEIMAALSAVDDEDKPMVLRYARELVRIVRRELGRIGMGLTQDSPEMDRVAEILTGVPPSDHARILGMLENGGFADRAREFRGS